MTVKARNLDLLGVRYVVSNMRASDWLEISNLVPRAYATVDMLTMLTVQHSRLGFLLEVDGIPAVVVQAVEKHNGCWSIGMFATDDFPAAWRGVVRFGRDLLLPSMLDLGARYCEAHVHAGNVAAQRFLERLGFRARSSVLENYGAFGEPFILYAVTREELPDVLRESPQSSGSQRAG